MTENLRPHRGVLILVLAIASLVTCPLIGVAPWVMGSQDLRAIDAGEVDPKGRDLTQAGMVIGIVGVVLMAFYTLVVGGFWILVMNATHRS